MGSDSVEELDTQSGDLFVFFFFFSSMHNQYSRRWGSSYVLDIYIHTLSVYAYMYTCVYLLFARARECVSVGVGVIVPRKTLVKGEL